MGRITSRGLKLICKLASASVAVVIGLSSVALADTLSVRIAEAKLFATPSGSAAVVKTIAKGEKVETKSRAGLYWQVKTADGTEGYMRSIDVARVESQESTAVNKAMNWAVGANRQKSEAGGSRHRTSTAVMGIRGLDENKDKAALAYVKPNMQAVYDMEDRAVDKAKVSAIESAVFAEIDAAAKQP